MIPKDDQNLIKGSSLTRCRFLIEDKEEITKTVRVFKVKESQAFEKIENWVRIECDKRQLAQLDPIELDKHVYALIVKYCVLGFELGKETYQFTEESI